MAGGEHPAAGPSLYALLGLSSTATSQELRRVFRSLSKLYHPDTTALPPGEAEERFRRLQEAYLVLSDPERRQAYDTQLRLALLQRVAALSAAAPAPAEASPPAGGRPKPLGGSIRPQSVRRALSGGEWFALVLLGAALLFSMVLGVGLAWWRGVELVGQPPGLAIRSGSLERAARQTGDPPGAVAGDDRPAPTPDAAVQPPVAGP